MLLLCVVTVIASSAQTFTVLAYVASAPYWGSLVQGLDGNFYGTTFGGGVGYGTVFKITPGGTVTEMHSFCLQSGCSDGSQPYAGLTLAASGNFYGTTSVGGTSGRGTVFEITPGGKFTTLHSFDGADGSVPIAGLVQSSDGDLYGTTFGGGTNGSGVVFRMSPSGTLATLYSFCALPGCADGSQPYAGLIQANEGNFYGTTSAGGANDLGTVFRITPSGKLTTLHSFFGQSHTEAGTPYGELLQAADGNFYGTTFYGGKRRRGTIFKVPPKGKNVTVLYNFCSQKGCVDGFSPYDGLFQGTDGNFYGTTFDGGTNGRGTVFSITPEGALIVLHDFCSQMNCLDGEEAFAGVVQGTNGTFYGTTSSNVVYSLNVGLGPFVTALPYSGKVGQNIKVLGQGLTGTTAVSFNGTAANFTVKSDTYLTAIVPPGAATGFVTVTTPSGTLTSNRQFQVKP